MMLHFDLSDLNTHELNTLKKALEVGYIHMECEGFCDKSCPNKKPCDVLACALTSIKEIIKYR